jgi:hypothetical protein
MPEVITGNESARQNIAKTILKYHDVRVDWRHHTWEQMSDLYQRLNQAKNIKRKWNIDIDWQNRPVQELVRIYASGRVFYD